MSYWQRIKNVLAGVVMLLFIPLLLLLEEEGIEVVAIILSLALLLYGVRLTWFYFSMARHMVGGKMMLSLGIIVLDLGLFTISVISQSTVFVLVYLLAVFVFAGAIDILRAFEAKRFEAPSWKFKLIEGAGEVAAAIAVGVSGFLFGSVRFAIYGFCAILLYAAVMRLVNAFRKTAIVYIG